MNESQLVNVTDLKRQLKELTAERDYIANELRDLKQDQREWGWFDYISADAELLSQFIREAGRIAWSFSLRDRAAGGDYGEFCRLLGAVRQIEWIEK